MTRKYISATRSRHDKEIRVPDIINEAENYQRKWLLHIGRV
jgi:hypothetical protein